MKKRPGLARFFKHENNSGIIRSQLFQMNLFTSCILMAVASFIVPATQGVLIITLTGSTVLALAGVAALAKAVGLAVGVAGVGGVVGGTKSRDKRQVSTSPYNFKRPAFSYV